MLNEIKIVIKWAKQNNETFAKMIKKEIWMLAHPTVSKFANQTARFIETVFGTEDEKILDILNDVYDKYATEEEAVAEIFNKYVEYKAKNGSVEAAKYIKFGNRHLGGLRNYYVETVRAFEKFEDLAAEV